MRFLKYTICAAGVLLAASQWAHSADSPYVYGQRVWPQLYGPTPVAAWSGVYVGLHGGFGGDEFTYPVSAPTIPLSATLTANSSGFFGGGQVGYNYQLAMAVFGVEADFAGANIKDNLSINSGGLSASAGTTLDWFGTVRGRLGFLVTPSLLLYGTGGFAYGHTTSTIDGSLTGFGSASYSFGHTKTGWTAGGGIEYAITPSFTFKTEYLYVDLGTDEITSGTAWGVPFSISEDTKVHTIKAGFNYRFGGSPF